MRIQLRRLWVIRRNSSSMQTRNDMFMGSPLQAWLDGENSPLRPGGFILGDRVMRIVAVSWDPSLTRIETPSNSCIRLGNELWRTLSEGWCRKDPKSDLTEHEGQLKQRVIESNVHEHRKETKSIKAWVKQFCVKRERKVMTAQSNRYGTPHSAEIP